jgi:hypothetical protein
MNAQQALSQIKNVKTTIFGRTVNKFNYPIQIRKELQKLSEAGEISPITYKQALDLTWDKMSAPEKSAEFELLNE